MQQPDGTVIAGIVNHLRTAQRLLIITGAGLSADSGLPTYRGIGGLYEGRLTDENIPIEQALSGEMLRQNAAISWKYIYAIEQACRGRQYNSGHSTIAAMQDYFEVCVLTQNVDGFHRAAGSRNIIEIHGDIHRLSCTRCDYGCSVTDYSKLDIPPRCPRCSAVIRPAVVLFGELLPQAALTKLDAELEQGFDLVFSIGTSSGFPYIMAPVLEAARIGIPTVEINPGETSISDQVMYRIEAGAADSLTVIWQHFMRRH